MKFQVKESTYGQMENHMMDNGRETKCTVMANWYGKMGRDMMETL